MLPIISQLGIHKVSTLAVYQGSTVFWYTLAANFVSRSRIQIQINKMLFPLTCKHTVL